MDMNMMPTSKPAMKFTIGRCGDSWIIKTKAPLPRDYEEDEKNAAEALLMLAAGGGGLFHISSSSTASPATTTDAASATKKLKFQPFPPPAKNNSHTCNECGKTFASHQALGGHKTSHRPKPAATNAVAAGDVLSAKNSSCRPHECTVCHEVFRTGQALGGHKRKHVDGITAGAATKRRRETSTSGGGDTSHVPVAFVREIDLNLQPLVELFSLRHSDLSSYPQLITSSFMMVKSFPGFLISNHPMIPTSFPP